MLELSRTVRFCVDLGGEAGVARGGGLHNTFAGWPSMEGLGAFYEITVRCRGEADPVTGYLVSISRIDESVRRRVIPIIEQAVAARRGGSSAALLPAIIGELRRDLDGQLRSVTWHLSPYHALTMDRAATDRVLISQRFEFSAAHRLHCGTLDDQENRRIFGKCNNPNGHGHNYVVEVTVDVLLSPPASPGDRPLSLPELERIVDERVIRRFDHKHLNLDTEEFASRNPSVEHIARVCYGLLDEPVAASGGHLEQVTVWETGKTSCTYRPDRR